MSVTASTSRARPGWTNCGPGNRAVPAPRPDRPAPAGADPGLLTHGVGLGGVPPVPPLRSAYPAYPPAGPVGADPYEPPEPFYPGEPSFLPPAGPRGGRHRRGGRHGWLKAVGWVGA